MILHQYDETPCPGMNCGTTDGKHSMECIAEHCAAAAGGDFVKWLPIESAPKDGRQLLVTWADTWSGTPHVEICQQIDGEAWMYTYDGDVPSKPPSHFSPLPAPPVPNK